MAARHPDRRRHRGRQLHRQLPEPVIGHARRALHRSANHSGAAAKVASRRSGGRGLPSRLSHSGVRPSHQPPAAVPWHSLSSPESRRQRDRTRDRCSAATEYRGTRRDSRPLRLWQWHRRTESGQNPAPVRVRPRWSSRIPTRIAHGFGHEHARVFMEAIGDRAAVPRWRSPHRTPRIDVAAEQGLRRVQGEGGGARLIDVTRTRAELDGSTAENDKGVISQSEYTLTKPSSCPNHRDHVSCDAPLEDRRAEPGGRLSGGTRRCSTRSRSSSIAA